ncbi:tetratricopeptide repeat protein [Marinicauda algicola]|uniref:Tetratricopeptide repeat protein n=1 Tax=Marinicauda algicola TaxID=2029849 RepID=A0A4V3RYE0_9PROT|nr:tetratricopeptide repeat protein [Marinicauda algicola]TGY89899.1 tetratricopeptide repeat protein [Marinicauda algicola]
MLRPLLLATLVAGLGGPASAELVDARLGPAEGGPALWLAFDTQPRAVRAAGEAPGIFEIDGVASPARVIEVALPAALERIVLAPVDADTVRLTLSGAIAGADAQLREGGVLIHLAEAERAAAASEPTPPAQRAPRELRAPGDSPVEPAPAASPSAADAVRDDETVAGPCAATQAQIAASPWDLDALSGHAACLAAEGLTDQAIGLYERVLAFEPGHYQAAMGLARLRTQRGETSVARELFLEAARNARTDGEALQARAAARRLEEG